MLSPSITSNYTLQDNLRKLDQVPSRDVNCGFGRTPEAVAAKQVYRLRAPRRLILPRRFSFSPGTLETNLISPFSIPLGPFPPVLAVLRHYGSSFQQRFRCPYTDWASELAFLRFSPLEFRWPYTDWPSEWCHYFHTCHQRRPGAALRLWAANSWVKRSIVCSCASILACNATTSLSSRPSGGVFVPCPSGHSFLAPGRSCLPAGASRPTLINHLLPIFSPVSNPLVNHRRTVLVDTFSASAASVIGICIPNSLTMWVSKCLTMGMQVLPKMIQVPKLGQGGHLNGPGRWGGVLGGGNHG